MSKYTYEESVRWMRSQPELSELVEQCYLDKDNLVAANRFASSEEFAAVAEVLELKTTHRRLRILDLGCGNGIASYAFASLGHDVFAVDIDPSADVGMKAAARLASQVSDGSISTVKAFAESLPFLNSTFDIIYARQALHHFYDLRGALTECSRVLKQGGMFLATREHVITDDQQLAAFLEEHILHKMHGGENAYPMAEYLSALETAEFKILRRFAPYDSIINHFPESNAQLRERFFQDSRKRFGRLIASVLLRVSLAEQVYRQSLSDACDMPGRLYSFLCLKERSS